MAITIFNVGLWYARRALAFLRFQWVTAIFCSTSCISDPKMKRHSLEIIRKVTCARASLLTSPASTKSPPLSGMLRQMSAAPA